MASNIKTTTQTPFPTCNRRNLGYKVTWGTTAPASVGAIDWRTAGAWIELGDNSKNARSKTQQPGERLEPLHDDNIENINARPSTRASYNIKSGVSWHAIRFEMNSDWFLRTPAPSRYFSFPGSKADRKKWT